MVEKAISHGFAYLALPNDPAVMQVMRDAQTLMGAEGIEWQSAPTLHVTLTFSPSVDDDTLAQIATSIHMPRPIWMEFDGIGVFENGEERAMHIRVKRSEALNTLQRQVFEAFAMRGIDLSPYSNPETWQPHITLAYLPVGVEVPEFDSAYGATAKKVIIGRDDYQEFAEITATQFKSIAVAADGRIFKDNASDTRRLMMIVTSNAYQDREQEIVSQQALEGYVESCWKDGDFVGDNPLLLWHGGEPIGDIIYAAMEGPFLIEIARERSNQIVNVARGEQSPLYGEVKAIWDALEQEPDLGASHMFGFLQEDESDGVYKRIFKKESSVLPRMAAANFLTDGEIIGV